MCNVTEADPYLLVWASAVASTMIATDAASQIVDRREETVITSTARFAVVVRVTHSVARARYRIAWPVLTVQPCIRAGTVTACCLGVGALRFALAVSTAEVLVAYIFRAALPCPGTFAHALASFAGAMLATADAVARIDVAVLSGESVGALARGATRCPYLAVAMAAALQRGARVVGACDSSAPSQCESQFAGWGRRRR